MSWEDLKYFKREEFGCRCGCNKNHFRLETAQKLDLAREISAVPYILTSAYRCPLHNTNIGSKSDVHPGGYAADVLAKDSRTRAKVVQGLMAAGFTRIGIDREFVHADDDPSKHPEVIWLY